MARRLGQKTGPALKRWSPLATAAKRQNPRHSRDSLSGARGTRTPDLLGAIQACASPEFGVFAGFSRRLRPGLRLAFRPVSAHFGWDRAKNSTLWPDLRSGRPTPAGLAAEGEHVAEPSMGRLEQPERVQAVAQRLHTHRPTSGGHGHDYHIRSSAPRTSQRAKPAVAWTHMREPAVTEAASDSAGRSVTDLGFP
jgi:hypothetical protein